MRSDPTLDSIAADLDSVLERLAAYLEEQPNRPAWLDDEPVALEGGADPELLAAILYRYAMGPPALRDAITAAQAAGDALDRKRSALVAQHGEKKAELLSALYACELARKFSQPVPLEDCMALAAAGNRYRKGHDKHLGGDIEVPTKNSIKKEPLYPPNRHARKHGFVRDLALYEVARRIMEDPQQHAVDKMGVFEDVSEEFEVISADMLWRDYCASSWPETIKHRKNRLKD